MKRQDNTEAQYLAYRSYKKCYNDKNKFAFI